MAKLESTIPDAVSGFRFRIEALGYDLGFASKISGLSSSTDVITYRGGADSNTFRKQKGLTIYDDIIMEQVLTDSNDVWTLLGLVFEPTVGLLGITSPIYKTDLTISLMDISGVVRLKYFVKQAWISRYEINELDANTSGLAIETVGFSHEGISQIGID